jgi:hypothetical protein
MFLFFCFCLGGVVGQDERQALYVDFVQGIEDNWDR